MEYVLTTDALTKTYRHSRAVDGVSLHVARGEIYGFVGRNGAGKTTLMRIVCGLAGKSGGSYALFGKRDDSRGIDAARRRVGAIIETPSVFPEYTAEENLRVRCTALGADEKIIPSVLEYVGLVDTGKKKARNFSLGMRQRLGIAAALVGSPDLLVLDEPTNGLDPQGIVEVRELLLRLNRERGITILISSHILGELSKLATAYGFIEKGVLLKEISARELEEACRKSVRITVDDTENLPYILERGLGIKEFKILSKTEADIYGEVAVGALALALVCAGLIVKIILLRASVRQIAEQAEEKLAEQSNAPISPDSADGIVRRLARGISRTLDETIMLGRKYREGDAELKRAVTNVSHDLRTPLTSAAGYAGLLKKSGLTPKQAEYLSVIEGRISAMRRLTEELLAYSVAASDETEPVLAEVDIAAALEDSLTQFYAAFEERGISPSIDIPQNEVVRIADKDALARVFGNVISNAVRYSDGDFCVTMKENGEITFENAASSLDEVSAKRLFDRFFTVENARGSAGLGLSIAKLFVEKMGGSIGASWAAGRLVIRIRL